VGARIRQDLEHHQSGQRVSTESVRAELGVRRFISRAASFPASFEASASRQFVQAARKLQCHELCESAGSGAC
jgi:hypothetical protein